MVAITSCYFFPFVLTALPLVNSKMLLAVVGLIFLGYNLTKKGNARLDQDFLTLSLWALAISIISFLSISYNNTPDTTFATYFMSMWVWLGGAYAVIQLAKIIHGGISVPIVVNYLLVVCVCQCIIALLFNFDPNLDNWAQKTFGGEGFMGNPNEDRLHGIGCALDVAGFRFAAVIVMTCYVIYDNTRKGLTNTITILLPFIAVLFIIVVGDMISRSTIIGAAFSLLFVLFVSLFKRGTGKLFWSLIIITSLCILITTYQYNTNPTFRANLRFGFEGFFSLVETGEWKSHSNEILKNMIIWPDNLKTWLIGDGYFNNPADSSLDTFDPYYVGKSFGGYYMATDIGYLRYIFYFGLLGMTTFALYFIKVCDICVRRFNDYKWMFILILFINFIQWFKVSTDLFVVFAPFLCFTTRENEEYMEIRYDKIRQQSVLS